MHVFICKKNDEVRPIIKEGWIFFNHRFLGSNYLPWRWKIELHFE